MNKVKLIAEIGWNHMGDMLLAENMIEAAAKSGADICKFQTWSEGNLNSGDWDLDGRREVYKKAQLTEEKHKLLKQICLDNNVEFLTSVFNVNDINFLKILNSKMIKIPSHEIYNVKLIKECTDNFDLVLISTGASKKFEIESLISEINLNKSVFMHCVSSYPCPANKVNLPRLQYIKKFTKIYGYSGHFEGIDDAIAAICQGATYIEKHFTINRDLDGRDNKFALLPQDFANISSFRNNYEEMQIDKGIDLQESEMDTFNHYRGRWSNDKK